jgi:hypothetical protein
MRSLLLALCVVSSSPALAESFDARGLVDRWLAAQNAGDFKSYQSLYAARFTGIRRSGPRTVRFDRGGWMKDRERMFQKPMSVSVDQVQIAAGASSAVVTFTQTWASGRYKDVGPKRLLLIREAGEPRISREEMLSSQMTPRPARRLDAFVPLYDGELLLAVDPQVELVGRTQLRSSWTAAVSPVNPKSLPADVARLVGTKVTIYGGDAPCEATVGRVHVVARELPSDGTIQTWREEKTPASAIGDEILGSGGRVLSAELSGGCKGTFARAADLAAPAIGRAAPADAALRALAIRAFAKAHKDWPIDPKAEARDRWDRKAKVTVLRGGVAHGQPLTLVQLEAERGETCSADSEYERLSTVFELREGAQPRLIPRGDIEGGTLTTVVDADDDGEPELLFDGGYLRRSADGYEVVESVTIPVFGCPC